jgi:hypothetical protein
VVPRAPGDPVLIQAMKPSPLIYAEMVQGLLKFVGLRKTIEICTHLYSYGWGWSYSCLHRLILQCAVDLDWDICFSIWSFAQVLLRQGYPMPKAVYARMLAFCSLAKNSNLFSEIFSQSLRNPKLPASEMLEMVRVEAEFLQDLWVQERLNPQ